MPKIEIHDLNELIRQNYPQEIIKIILNNQQILWK